MANPFQPKFVDLVRNYTTSTGTGNITLGQAVAGHGSLAQAVPVGERFFYCISGVDKPAESEVGRGTMLSNGTVAREPIAGPLTNFTTGSKTIALVVGAEWFGKIGAWINGGAESLAALATTNKSSLVGAVNELAASSGGGGGGGTAGLSLTFATCAGSAIAAATKGIDTIGHSVAGVGGARYVFDAAVNAAFVTANPRTAFLAADGRGFRLDHTQRLTLEMFGAVADYVSNTNRGTDNYAAIMAALEYRPKAGLVFTPQIHAGLGAYYSAQTIEPHGTFALSGVPHASANVAAGLGFAATRIVTPTDTTCLRVVSGNTTGDTTQPGISSSSMSSVKYVCFEQTTKGTSLNAHGVHCRAAALIESCTFTSIAGDGIRIAATAGGSQGAAMEGEANNWLSINNFAHDVGGNGHYAFGQDANIGFCRGFRTQVCGLTGVRDDSAFVNVYEQLHIAGYGTGGVQYGGRAWQPIADSTNQAPANGSACWYDRGPLASPGGAFPAWSSATAYKAVGPVISSGAATFHGVYVEGAGEYGYSHCGGGTVFGPNMGWTLNSKVLSSTEHGLATPHAIGHYRSTLGQGASHAAYAEIGDEEVTVLGGLNPNFSANDHTQRRTILDHRVKGAQMLWFYAGKDQVVSYGGRNQWSISGVGTARTYGRAGPVEGIFTLHDHAIQNLNDNANARIHGIRDTIPPNSEGVDGEWRWDCTGSANVGWKKVAGAWSGAALGFSGSYAGDANFGNLFVGGSAAGKVIAVKHPATSRMSQFFQNSGGNTVLQCYDPGAAFVTSPAIIYASTLDYYSDYTSPAVTFSGTGVTVAAGKVIKVGADQVVGARGAAVPADASDLASAIALVNALKARIVAHGLVAA